MQHTDEQLPFESYPQHGRDLIGRGRGDNCRHGYGWQFIMLTGQTHCAYCGIDLMGTYENWLTMALDHVVPHSICLVWNLPADWREDHSNRALSCTACNTFGNHYRPKGFEQPTTLDEFYNLRDAIFLERKRLILDRHQQERAFFQQVRTLNVRST